MQTMCRWSNFIPPFQVIFFTDRMFMAQLWAHSAYYDGWSNLRWSAQHNTQEGLDTECRSKIPTYFYIDTESAWGRFSLVVAMSVCLYVWLSQLNYCQLRPKGGSFNHPSKIYFVRDKIRFLNIKGHQNWMIGAKGTAM